MRFHGRELELRALRRSYDLRGSALWVVYGRRRVGKTALLKEFTLDKPAFFYTAGVEDSRAQMRRFLNELAAHSGQQLYAQLRPSSWTDALDALDQHLTRVERKTVVVLDEFQWMCRGTSSVLSDVQRLWDTRWKRSGRVQLVLCGSAVSFMVGEVLAQKSPLFGRRTGSIHLEPLSAREAAPFFGKRSVIEQAEAMICLGGIPAYLERFEARPAVSVQRVLDELAFQRGGYLVDEIRFVFSEQLDKAERYHEIVSQLASAPRSAADLARGVGVNSGQMAFYLQRLLLLGLVERHRPIGMPARAKTIRYRLWDEYLRFYFHYVEPNLVRIRSRRSDFRFDRITRESWDTFLGLGFELLVRRNIDVIAARLDAQDVIARVGTYWHRATKRRPGVQVDIVLEREDNVTNLVECKWARKPVGSEVLAALERKCQLFPNPKQHTLQPVLVAAGGATSAVHRAQVPVVTLKDLFMR